MSSSEIEIYCRLTLPLLTVAERIDLLEEETLFLTADAGFFPV